MQITTEEKKIANHLTSCKPSTDGNFWKKKKIVSREKFGFKTGFLPDCKFRLKKQSEIMLLYDGRGIGFLRYSVSGHIKIESQKLFLK